MEAERKKWALPLTPGAAPLDLLMGKAQGKREAGSVVPKGPSAPKRWDSPGLATGRAGPGLCAWENQASAPDHPAGATSPGSPTVPTSD